MTNNNDLINRAALGDDDPLDLLRRAGINAIRKQAGLIPNNMTEPIKPTVQDVHGQLQHQWAYDAEFLTEETITTWLQDTHKYGRVPNGIGVASTALMREHIRHDEYLFLGDPDKQEKHEKRTRINGIVDLPTMPMKHPLEVHSPLYKVMAWSRNRAWIAGSAATARLIENQFSPNDIDLFCHTDEFYNQLCNELRRDYQGSQVGETKRSVTYQAYFPVESWQMLHINLVRPNGEDWFHPWLLLRDFDLTPAGAIIKNHKECIVWKRSTFSDNKIDFINIEKSKPLRLMQRITKYISRGFMPGYDFWQPLADHPQHRQLLIMVQSLAQFFANAELPKRMKLKATIENAFELDDYDDDDYYNDSGEHWEDENYYEDDYGWY